MVFVDENMVWPSMRAIVEQVGWVAMGHGNCLDTGNDWLLKPGWKRRIEETVLDEFGGPGLEPSMGQLLPPWPRCGGYFIQDRRFFVFGDEVGDVVG